MYQPIERSRAKAILSAAAITCMSFAGAAYAAPNVGLAPEQVVANQLAALKNNTSNDAGIASAYAYASPTFTYYYPTLSSWSAMLKNTANHSNVLLNHYSSMARPILNYGYTAQQSVQVTAPTGKVVDFLFNLTKQSYGTCTGCWLTDSIVVQAVSYTTPPTGQAPTLDSIGVTTSGTSATVSGTASDANGNLSTVQVELDGSSTLSTVTPNASGAWTYTVNNLSNGNHAFRARAVDSGGLQSAWSATQNFSIGGTNPPPSGCSNADIDTSKLNGISTWLSSNTNYFDSVLVMHCDTILFEAYRNGFTADTMHELQSATKTFSSTLVAIMLKKGLVTSLDQKISELLPSKYAPLFTGQKANITVRHLLTMTSGLAWTDFGTNNSFDQITAAADSVQYVLSQTLNTTPGQTFAYNTGSSHLLSAIVHYKSGKTTKQFAEDELFGPLGITSYTWPTLQDGVAQGGWGMYMKPRDFIKLAKLYRDGGVYNGVQILDKSYTDAAVVRQTITDHTLESYGFQMWIEEDFGVTSPNVVAGARGYGGQDSLLARTKNFAVVFTGSIDQPSAMAADTKTLFKTYIVPSHTGADHPAN